MALKRNETYPGRFDNPSPEHPQGAFKNRSAADARDGSYLEKAWANDWDGYFSSLLSSAGITPNGSVDAVGASQYFDALLVAVQNAVNAAPNKNGIQGSHSNLKASTTGTSASVLVSAGDICVKNTAGDQKILTGVSLTALSFANSGANGLDVGAGGSQKASTWYSVWVIWNPTTNTTAGLLSESFTNPTMPSGYTHKAKVWSAVTGTDKLPKSLIKVGRRSQYKVASGSNTPALPIMASGSLGNVSTPTWSPVAVGSYVPPDATRIICVMCGGSAGTLLIGAPNNSYGGYQSVVNPPPIMLNTAQANAYADFVLEGPNIYYASNSGGNALVTCFGWEDGI